MRLSRVVKKFDAQRATTKFDLELFLLHCYTALSILQLKESSSSFADYPVYIVEPHTYPSTATIEFAVYV